MPTHLLYPLVLTLRLPPTVPTPPRRSPQTRLQPILQIPRSWRAMLPQVLIACNAHIAVPACRLCCVAVLAAATPRPSNAGGRPYIILQSFLLALMCQLSTFSLNPRINPFPMPLIPQMALKSCGNIYLPRTIPASNSRDVLITHSWYFGVIGCSGDETGWVAGCLRRCDGSMLH
jgi:hypothetical protein